MINFISNILFLLFDWLILYLDKIIYQIGAQKIITLNFQKAAFLLISFFFCTDN